MAPPHTRRGDSRLVLPMALQHLTPQHLLIGIGAIAAAVMSSRTQLYGLPPPSSIQHLQKHPQDQGIREGLQWVIVPCGVWAWLVQRSPSYTSIMFSDPGLRHNLPIMFSTRLCLFFNISNWYGSVMGLLVGVLLRVLSGEPL
ncbi:hypothetical protein FQN60_010190 [Etheostoma spectabile]|uniref:Uncharacterized protein n=1 Tax=Etheostoma spectabile TaxID=54343 RepID=A0A5J5D8E2_9PERO|nr:hypothetical protein FQN60_010190 [Etheostoma spectabile]